MNQIRFARSAVVVSFVVAFATIGGLVHSVAYAADDGVITFGSPKLKLQSDLRPWDSSSPPLASTEVTVISNNEVAMIKEVSRGTNDLPTFDVISFNFETKKYTTLVRSGQIKLGGAGSGPVLYDKSKIAFTASYGPVSPHGNSMTQILWGYDLVTKELSELKRWFTGYVQAMDLSSIGQGKLLYSTSRAGSEKDSVVFGWATFDPTSKSDKSLYEYNGVEKPEFDRLLLLSDLVQLNNGQYILKRKSYFAYDVSKNALFNTVGVPSLTMFDPEKDPVSRVMPKVLFPVPFSSEYTWAYDSPAQELFKGQMVVARNYSTDIYKGPVTEKTEIWTVPLDDQNPKLVAEFTAEPGKKCSMGGRPRLLPDGRFMIILRSGTYENVNYNLYTLDLR